MLRHDVLCCAVLGNDVLRCNVLSCDGSCAVLCHDVVCWAVLGHDMLRRDVLRPAELGRARVGAA